MKDCKEHYSEMRQVRMGEAECPWCKLTEAQAEIERLKEENTKLFETRKERIKEHAGTLNELKAGTFFTKEEYADHCSETVTKLKELHGHIAALERERDELKAAIYWALGDGDSDFGEHKLDYAPTYWWRTELRKRAGNLPVLKSSE